MKSITIVLTIMLTACITALKSDDKLIRHNCTMGIECNSEEDDHSQEEKIEQCVESEKEFLVTKDEVCYEEQRAFLECTSEIKDCEL